MFGVKGDEEWTGTSKGDGGLGLASRCGTGAPKLALLLVVAPYSTTLKSILRRNKSGGKRSGPPCRLDPPSPYFTRPPHSRTPALSLPAYGGITSVLRGDEGGGGGGQGSVNSGLQERPEMGSSPQEGVK